MPTFSKCPDEVYELARVVLCKFDNYECLLDAKIKIDFVFASADKDEDGNPKGPALKHRGRPALGITRPTKLKERVMGRGDAEVTLDADWWATASNAECEALLDHELYHINLKVNKDGSIAFDDIGRPVLVMRKHDVEIGWFSVVADRHGAKSQEQQQAKHIFEVYQQSFWPELLEVKHA
jgi:hypothetical protein